MHDEITKELVYDHHSLDRAIDEISTDLGLLRGDIAADAIEFLARMRVIVLEADFDKRWHEFMNLTQEMLISSHSRKTAIELLDVSSSEAGRLLSKLDKSIQAYEQARDREAESLRLERDLLQQKLDQRYKVHSPADRSIREQVAAVTGNRCFYCDADLEQETLHVDHIVPKNAGGPDHISNYVPACAKCNGSKGDRPFAPFFLKAKSEPTHLTVVSNQGDAA